MTDIELKPAAAKAMKALDAAEGKRLTLSRFREASGVTIHAWPTMYARMQVDNLIVVHEVQGTEPVVEITFGGLRAVRKIDTANL